MNFRFFLFLLLMVQIQACRPAATREQIMQSLGTHSSETISVSSSSRELEQLLAVIKNRLSESQTNALRDKLQALISKERIESIYRDELKNFTDQELKKIYEFDSTSSAEKIRKAAQKSKTTEGIYEIQIFQSNLRKDPPEESRKKLVDEYLRVSGSAELTEKIMMNSASFFAELEPSPQARLEAQKALKNPALKSALTEGVLAGVYYSFKDLSDSELGDYIEFLKSPAGSKYHKLNAALAQQTNQQIFAQLRASLSQKKSN